MCVHFSCVHVWSNAPAIWTVPGWKSTQQYILWILSKPQVVCLISPSLCVCAIPWVGCIVLFVILKTGACTVSPTEQRHHKVSTNKLCGLVCMCVLCVFMHPHFLYNLKMNHRRDKQMQACQQTSIDTCLCLWTCFVAFVLRRCECAYFIPVCVCECWHTKAGLSETVCIKNRIPHPAASSN